MHSLFQPEDLERILDKVIETFKRIDFFPQSNTIESSDFISSAKIFIQVYTHLCKKSDSSLEEPYIRIMKLLEAFKFMIKPSETKNLER